MPAVQTSYAEGIRPAVAGAKANMEPAVVISRNVEDAAGIGFGLVVQQGAEDDGCTADLTTVDITAASYLGITMLDRTTRFETPDTFAQFESARIMRKGVIWVEVAVAVTPLDPVTVAIATGVIGVTAVGAGFVAIPNARWDSSTAGAGLAKLRLS